MIKAVIFDWGGVLIKDIEYQRHGYLAKRLNVSYKKFLKEHKKLNPNFEKNKITEKEYWKIMSKKLDIKNVPTCLWRESFVKLYKENKEMFFLASKLQKKYKTAVLSNAIITDMNYFYMHRHSMFGTIVFSCKAKTRKPERKIYNLILKKLNVNGKEAVFIDNRKINIVGAKKAGLNAFLFKNPKQVKRKLAFLSEN